MSCIEKHGEKYLTDWTFVFSAIVVHGENGVGTMAQDTIIILIIACMLGPTT